MPSQLFSIIMKHVRFHPTSPFFLLICFVNLAVCASFSATYAVAYLCISFGVPFANISPR